jgi:hypothetical protein
MRKMTYISVIAVYMLTGCSTDYLTDPTQWRERFTADSALCQRYAGNDNELFPRCMSSRGWSQSGELLRESLP